MNKSLPFSLLFIFLLALRVSSSDLIYLTPMQECSGGCTGTQTNPFDNLLDAVHQASSSSSATILLLYSSSASHYLLDQAYTNGGSGAPSPTDPSAIAEFTIEDLIIKPLFCDEEPAKSDSSLSTLCFDPDSKPTIFLKTTKFKLTVTGSLIIQNIVFDAIEDIRTWNTAGDTDLEDCLSNHKRCCDSSQTPSTLYPDSLICDWHNDYSLDVINSLFYLSDDDVISGSSPREIQFTDCKFRNFLGPERVSLIRTGPRPFKLTLDGVVLDRVYFDSGVISYEDSSSLIGSSGGTNSSSIIIQNTVLKNYNDWNMFSQSSTRREGYLFNAQNTFSGSLQISESVFQDSASSLRNTCWDQTTDYYQRPMNNLLKTEPRSRSNLWNQYHQETGTSNDYISSLIFIESLYGAVSIKDSSFNNIIGTSGSILRIDDIISSDTWLTIYNSNFDATFAFDKFAGIMIIKRSDPKFASMLKCPYFEVFNSTFTNSYGCPGAYGNLLYLCYWASQPPISTSSSKLSSYNFGSQAATLTTSWSSESPDYTVRMIQSTFTNNLLAVSNSLALIGTSSVLIKDNIFKDNGGTTAEIAQYSLENSYFLERFPSALNFPLPLTHFGQSSSILLDHFVQFHSLNNTFQGNFGPWEGSMALASSVTLLNWIKMANGITSQDNSFIDHQGIPPYLLPFFNQSNDASYVPIFALGIDTEGSRQVADQSFGLLENPQDPVQIIFTNIDISNNIASFNYGDYTYNYQELEDTIWLSLTANSHFRSGLIKLLWNSEVLDNLLESFPAESISSAMMTFSLIGGKIQNNQLLNQGCLFKGSFSFLHNLLIQGNLIDLEDEYFIESELFEDSYDIWADYYSIGLFCVGSPDFSGPASLLRLVATSLFVQDNQGILINLFPNSQASGYLSDSIFFNNTCLALSMISVRSYSDWSSLNNLFIANFNSLGNTYSYVANSVSSISNTHLYSDGKYASLYYTESSPVFECLAKAYWNTLSPTYKVFTDGMIPQSGLYFTSYSVLTLFQSTYEENTGYGGLIVAYGGNTYLESTEISNNHIVGTSVFGTFLSIASLDINNLFLVNNTITKDPLLPKNRPAVFSLLNCNLNAKNIDIFDGAASEGSSLFLVLLTNGQITNMTVQNFYRHETGEAPLIILSYSTFSVENLECYNTTGIFKLEGGVFDIKSSTFQNITNLYQSQFLMLISDSELTLEGLTYSGNSEYNELIPLVGGQKNTITASNLHFTNAGGGQGIIFDFKSTELFFISDSIFEYSEEASAVTVFKLILTQNLIIQRCVFNLVGAILSASEVNKNFHFIDNTLFTNSSQQNLALHLGASILIQGNYFINTIENFPSTFPTSQVTISDSLSDITLEGNFFYSLYGQYGIVQLSASNNSYSAVLNENIFIGNTASNGGGGALYLYAETKSSCKAQIENSIFVLNQATKGGAIYQTTSQKTKQKLILTNNHFIKNTAEALGGAIYFDYSQPKISSDCTFIDNYAAQYPNHIGSYPIQLILLQDQEEASTLLTSYNPGTRLLAQSKKQNHIWENIGSGVVNKKTYTFALLDMFNQLVYDDNSSLLQIYPAQFTEAQRKTFSSQLSIQANQGLYTLQDFEFTYKANYNLDVAFISSAIIPSNIPSGLNPTSSIKIQINFRSCGIGEFSVQVNGFASCESCPSGFWQIDENTNAASCSVCDQDTTICLGGNNVGPKYGYWRYNATGDIITKCPVKWACLGNENTTTLNPIGSCEENHLGNLCYGCVKGFAKNSSHQCVDCRTSSISYFLLVLWISLKGGIIILGIRKALEFANKHESEKSADSNLSVLLRSLISYTQIYALIIGVPISWPDILDNVLSSTGKVSTVDSQIFTLDCFYKIAEEAFGVRTIFLKSLLTFFMPIIFLLLGTLFWTIYFRVKKMPILRNQLFADKIIITIVIVCFSQQPDVIKDAMALFRCQNLYREDTSLEFLVDSYDVKCWEGEHFSWIIGLALPILVVWAIILPGIMLSILFKNRKKLGDPEISKRYSFLFKGYREKVYYWEVIVMIKKILFISNLVFVTSVNSNIFNSLILLLISYTIQSYANPYSTLHLNKLEIIGICSLGVVNLCGLYFEIVDSTKGLDMIILIIGLVGNLFFLAYFVSLFFVLQINKYKNHPRVKKILAFIDRKCCKFRHRPSIKRLTDNLSRLFARTLEKIPTISIEFAKLNNETSSLVKKFDEIYQDTPNDCRSICSETNLQNECLSSPKGQEDDDIVPPESLNLPSVPRFVSSPSQMSSLSEEDIRSSFRRLRPTLLLESPKRIRSNLRKKSRFSNIPKRSLIEKNKLTEIITSEGLEIIEDPSEIFKSIENEIIESQVPPPLNLVDILRKIDEDVVDVNERSNV